MESKTTFLSGEPLELYLSTVVDQSRKTRPDLFWEEMHPNTFSLTVDTGFLPYRIVPLTHCLH